ncbi:hypothetical protein OGATHE_003375 [Ogataea polymorpha]|uniref:Uncharacterized protein n=1 Tax=Ogataea polymorpha TaxID=460523 RepID=A0A9P8P3I3_9ASCO|nr:hypothetical protein OGATHE_003375 [Ogataea polymorpha]
MSNQLVSSRATFSFTLWVNLLTALKRTVTSWLWALLIVASVDFGVSVSQLDRNVSFQLVLESNSLNSGNSADDSTLSVGNVTNSTDVNGGLSVDDFW